MPNTMTTSPGEDAAFVCYPDSIYYRDSFVSWVLKLSFKWSPTRLVLPVKQSQLPFCLHILDNCYLKEDPLDYPGVRWQNEIQ